MTRNEVIDEVLEAIKNINEHNEPMPDRLKPSIDESFKASGLEQMMRTSAEAMKFTVLDAVAELKN